MPLSFHHHIISVITFNNELGVLRDCVFHKHFNIQIYIYIYIYTY